jgi:hypothetical protein
LTGSGGSRILEEQVEELGATGKRKVLSAAARAAAGPVAVSSLNLAMRSRPNWQLPGSPSHAPRMRARNTARRYARRQVTVSPSSAWACGDLDRLRRADLGARAAGNAGVAELCPSDQAAIDEVAHGAPGALDEGPMLRSPVGRSSA